MSATLRARYRNWWMWQHHYATQYPGEIAPAAEGLHFWHRLRIRRMYGRHLF